MPSSRTFVLLLSHYAQQLQALLHQLPLLSTKPTYLNAPLRLCLSGIGRSSKSPMVTASPGHQEPDMSNMETPSPNHQELSMKNTRLSNPGHQELSVNNMQSSTRDPTSLFTLPPEIRVMIYRYLFDELQVYTRRTFTPGNRPSGAAIYHVQKKILPSSEVADVVATWNKDKVTILTLIDIREGCDMYKTYALPGNIPKRYHEKGPEEEEFDRILHLQ
ncbi:hypothetical protein EDD36DRAFT_463238 [Exophiala viscosa]|uniref:Uncharacterized protein n=1 Tax=Exophiala viscosa TaxID=2486360 RepID=A0AAN6E334_9EURO|nr:hypothetical protein EDD36DRAFT_463238 [Exophiala viscosa]